MQISVSALPDDVLANALSRLPAQSLAVARCVCKPWRDIVDARALLIPQLLPRSVHGVFINYVGHDRPHLFAGPSSSTAAIDGMLGFMPNDHGKDRWSVLDHCNGLLLCNIDKERSLCVCNPATRQWMPLPPCEETRIFEFVSYYRRQAGFAGAYLAFDPAVSQHYEVVLIPAVPQKPSPPPEPTWGETREQRAWRWRRELENPFCLDWFFESPEDTVIDAVDDEKKAGEGEEVEVSFSSVEDEEDEFDSSDPTRLTEWPPSTWTLNVFSSKTGRWEQRDFAREGDPAGLVKHMRMEHYSELKWYGPRRRYAVYCQGALYVHCQGAFVARIHLSLNSYQIITVPTFVRGEMPYVGRSKDGIYFGGVHEKHLCVWILDESHGQMEWVLKYRHSLRKHSRFIRSFYRNYKQMAGPWRIQEDNVGTHGSNNGSSETSMSFMWDPENGNFLSDEDGEGSILDILGFHPYEEVVFLVEPFGAAAYHLNSSKIEYLGDTRPKSYEQTQMDGTHESFVYTPCFIRVHRGDSLSPPCLSS